MTSACRAPAAEASLFSWAAADTPVAAAIKSRTARNWSLMFILAVSVPDARYPLAALYPAVDAGRTTHRSMGSRIGTEGAGIRTTSVREMSATRQPALRRPLGER